MLSLTQSPAQNKTAVKYDRSAKRWLAVNGKTHSFPAGKSGKRQALLLALEIDQPQLHAIVKAIADRHHSRPELVDRLIKACQLLTHDQAYADGQVSSQSEPMTTYQTGFTGVPSGYWCSCSDFEQGLQRQAGLAQHGGADCDFNDSPVCKHILAQHVAWLADLDLPDQSIPFDGTSWSG